VKIQKVRLMSFFELAAKVINQNLKRKMSFKRVEIWEIIFLTH